MSCREQHDKIKVSKAMAKTTIKAKKRDHTAEVVGEITGVTADYVRKVRKGERENEDVLLIDVEYHQRHSKLITELKRIVPITSKPRRRAA